MTPSQATGSAPREDRLVGTHKISNPLIIELAFPAPVVNLICSFQLQTSEVVLITWWALVLLMRTAVIMDCTKYNHHKVTSYQIITKLL